MPTPYPYRATLPAGLKPPVTLLGDSTMAALVWNASAGKQAQDHIRANYTLGLEAESCQRIVVRSCRGRFGYVPPTTIQQMQARSGSLGEAIVVMAGYDDVNITGGIDAVMAEAARQGVPHVIWLTYRSNVDYILPGGARARTLYTGHNAVLRQRASVYPTLTVADWDGYSALQPQWFASDGIHINPTGTIELGKFIRAQLDALPLGRCMAQASVGVVVPAAPRYVPVSATGIVASPTLVALDTRPQDRDPWQRKLGAARMIAVPLPAGVPTSATKLKVRVVAADTCRAGRIYATACGQDPRTGPNAGFLAGWVMPVDLVVPRGKVCVYVSATSDVIVYITGWDRPPPPTATPPTSAPTTTTTAAVTLEQPAATEPVATNAPTTTATTTVISDPATTEPPTTTTQPPSTTGPPASGG